MHGLDEYDSEARWYYPAIMRTTTIDPLAEKYYSISPYAWCGNNPVLMVDPDGRAFETAWDLYSLATGAKSFVNNARQGNVGAAILDGVGVIADAAAVVVPGVPGGVGAGIKAVRAGDKALDAVKAGKTAEKVAEGTKVVNKNANNAEGHFMLYEVKSADGEVLKVGKADASRVNSQGQPVRMKASERQAQKTNPGATATPKKDLGQTTTAKAKEAEAAEVRQQRANGNALPLNKERDKRYRN